MEKVQSRRRYLVIAVLLQMLLSSHMFVNNIGETVPLVPGRIQLAKVLPNNGQNEERVRLIERV